MHGVELGMEICTSVVNTVAHLLVCSLARGGYFVCDVGLNLNNKNGDFFFQEEHNSKVDGTCDALGRLKSNLVVFGSWEERVEEGVEWPKILVFVGAALVNVTELISDKTRQH